MLIKGTFSNRPARIQLLVFLLLILAGAFLSSFLGIGIFFLTHGTSANMYQYPGMLRFIQLLSSLGTFLLPALSMAWLCSNTPLKYLSLEKRTSPSVYILALLAIALLMPTINLTEILNRQMIFPDFLKPIEEWMFHQEESAERLTKTLLSNNDILSLFSNLIVIAVAAAIGEEFFFRGVLQQIMGKWTKNHHVIIWTIAILFSAFHMQFYGFLPRMLLGAFLGYLLYWSGTIWLPVFIHFIYNAVVVIILSNKNLSEKDFLTGEIAQEQLIPYSLCAIFSFSLFIFTCRILQKKTSFCTA